MTLAGTGLEVARLADLLEVDTEHLSGLGTVPAGELRALRHAITGTVHARHRRRFRRLAGMVKMAPLGLSAKVARKAFGPIISARVAGSMDPEDAVGLARHLDADFLAQVAAHLDPASVSQIITALPSDLVVDVGKRMLAAGELAALGGLVSSVEHDEALAVAADADPADLLRIGLFTEEPEALDALIADLPDAQVNSVIEAAASSDHVRETLLLVGALSPDNVERLLRPVADMPKAARERYLAAIREDPDQVPPQVHRVLESLGLKA